jgi:hypothetical protein
MPSFNDDHLGFSGPELNHAGSVNFTAAGGKSFSMHNPVLFESTAKMAHLPVDDTVTRAVGVDGSGNLVNTSKVVDADITTLTAAVNTKADTSVVTALTAVVATKASSTVVGSKASQVEVDSIAATVADKADTSTVTALTTTVGTKADTSTVTALTTTVGTKADTSTVTALTTTVGTKADASTVTALSNTVNTDVFRLSTASNTMAGSGGITNFYMTNSSNGANDMTYLQLHKGSTNPKEMGMRIVGTTQALRFTDEMNLEDLANGAETTIGSIKTAGIDLATGKTYAINGTALASTHLTDAANLATQSDITTLNSAVASQEFFKTSASSVVHIKATSNTAAHVPTLKLTKMTGGVTDGTSSIEMQGTTTRHSGSGNYEFHRDVNAPGAGTESLFKITADGQASASVHPVEVTLDSNGDAELLVQGFLASTGGVRLQDGIQTYQAHVDASASLPRLWTGISRLQAIMAANQIDTTKVMKCNWTALPMNTNYAQNDYLTGTGSTHTPQTLKYSNHYQTVFEGETNGLQLISKSQSSVSSPAYSVDVTLTSSDWSGSNLILSGVGYIYWAASSFPTSVSRKNNKLIRVGHHVDDAVRITIDGQPVVFTKYSFSMSIAGTGNDNYNSVFVARGDWSALEIMYMAGTGGNYMSLQFNVMAAWD